MDTVVGVDYHGALVTFLLSRLFICLIVAFVCLFVTTCMDYFELH